MKRIIQYRQLRFILGQKGGLIFKDESKKKRPTIHRIQYEKSRDTDMPF